MRISDSLKKAAGLFVELPEEAQPAAEWNVMDAPAPTPAVPVRKTVEQIVRDTPGPNLDEIHVPSNPTGPVIAPDGTVDYKVIYQLAGLTEPTFAAEQMLELLGSLPKELPIETRRTTVKVTLEAMAKTTEVSSESIVADASRKLAALAAYATSYVKQADDYVAKTEQDIAVLEQQIAQLRQRIADTKEKQTQMVGACQSQCDHLDDVLEFFSLDVPPSKYSGS